MQAATRQAYDESRALDGKPFRAGCYAPFTSILFLPSGDGYVCCRNGVQILGNVTTTSVREMWEGSTMRELRRALLDYQFGGGCEFCGWSIENGDYRGSLTQSFEHLPVADESPRWPSQIEFALSNTCNFACVQCGGMYSSRIRTQREGLPPLPKVYGDRFFEEIASFLPHAHTLKFTGGEPFLAEENFRIWGMMHDLGCQPADLSVLTNGSQWNARVEEVLGRFRFRVGVSIDGVDRDVLERVRVGAVHREVMANIQRLRSYTRSVGTQLFLSFSWMQQNRLQLPAILRFAEELDATVQVIRLVHPAHCSVFALPMAERRKLLAALEAESDRLRPHLRRNLAAWDGALAALRADVAAGGGREISYSQVSAIYHETPAAEFQRHFDSGRWDDAIAVADALVDSHPEAPRLRVLAAAAARQAGRTEDAARRLDAVSGLCRRFPLYWSEVAWQRLAEGRAADGLAAVAEGRRGPASSGTNAALAHVECVLLAELGRGDELVRAGADLLAARPDAEAELELARLLAKCRRPEALGHFRAVAAALPAGPERAEVWLTLAELAWEDGDLVEARRQVEQALADHPSWARGWWSLACLEERVGDAAAAQRALARAEQHGAAGDPAWLAPELARLRDRLGLTR